MRLESKQTNHYSWLDFPPHEIQSFALKGFLRSKVVVLFSDEIILVKIEYFAGVSGPSKTPNLTPQTPLALNPYPANTRPNIQLHMAQSPYGGHLRLQMPQVNQTSPQIIQAQARMMPSNLRPQNVAQNVSRQIQNYPHTSQNLPQSQSPVMERLAQASRGQQISPRQISIEVAPGVYQVQGLSRPIVSGHTQQNPLGHGVQGVSLPISASIVPAQNLGGQSLNHGRNLSQGQSPNIQMFSAPDPSTMGRQNVTNLLAQRQASVEQILAERQRNNFAQNSRISQEYAQRANSIPRNQGSPQVPSHANTQHLNVGARFRVQDGTLAEAQKAVQIPQSRALSSGRPQTLSPQNSQQTSVPSSQALNRHHYKIVEDLREMANLENEYNNVRNLRQVVQNHENEILKRKSAHQNSSAQKNPIQDPANTQSHTESLSNLHRASPHGNSNLAGQTVQGSPALNFGPVNSVGIPYSEAMALRQKALQFSNRAMTQQGNPRPNQNVIFSRQTASQNPTQNTEVVQRSTGPVTNNTSNLIGTPELQKKDFAQANQSQQVNVPQNLPRESQSIQDRVQQNLSTNENRQESQSTQQEKPNPLVSTGISPESLRCLHDLLMAIQNSGSQNNAAQAKLAKISVEAPGQINQPQKAPQANTSTNQQEVRPISSSIASLPIQSIQENSDIHKAIVAVEQPIQNEASRENPLVSNEKPQIPNESHLGVSIPASLMQTSITFPVSSSQNNPPLDDASLLTDSKQISAQSQHSIEGNMATQPSSNQNSAQNRVSQVVQNMPITQEVDENGGPEKHSPGQILNPVVPMTQQSLEMSRAIIQNREPQIADNSLQRREVLNNGQIGLGSINCSSYQAVQPQSIALGIPESDVPIDLTLDDSDEGPMGSH